MIRNNLTIYHWIVFWGVLPIVFATLDAGDYAAIISAVVLVGGLVVAWFKFRSGRSHPFIMRISLDPYHIKPRQTRRVAKRLDLDVGDNKILIYISPRKGTSWGRVNMRLVNRKLSLRFNRLWKYEDTDQNIIEVTDFKDVIYETQGEIWGRYFESDPDGVGGYDGVYNPELLVKEGELVWFDVYIRANDVWQGYLSFEGALENRRAWSRIKTKVNRPRHSSTP
ncbi:hypothetical protein ES703_90113 [subsurface metagenome]